MRTLGFAFLALLMTSAAYAQTSSTPGSSPSSSSSMSGAATQTPSESQSSQTQQVSGAQIANQIRGELESAGFKNIRLLPSSFIVRAEDKNGNPVMMVLNPDSLTSVTAIRSNNNTVGQSPGSGSSDQQTTGSSTQQTPGSSDQGNMSGSGTRK